VRTLRAAIITAALVALTGSGCIGATPLPPGPSAGATSGFLTYHDSTFGFRIEYPPDWSAQAGTEGTVATFLSSGATGGFASSVAVQAEGLSDPSQTLQRYADVWLSEQARSISGYRLVSSDPGVLSDRSAQRVTYTGQLGTIDLRWEAVLVVDRGRAFALTFVAAPNRFDGELATAEAIIQSFALD